MTIINSGEDPGIGAAGSVIAGFFSGAVLFPAVTQILGQSAMQGMTTAVTLSYMLARYYFGNLGDIQPAAVIGGIPLGTVSELSHGISDREVKYRANGGVFLAHQDGGNESLRIVGKAWGPNRFLFLNMLDFLFLYGSSTMIDVFREAADYIESLSIPRYPSLSALTTASTTVDPWQEFELNANDEGFREHHATFPIITRNRIYMSMYIETYSWRQEIEEDGRQAVTYTIFFRKYEPEPPYEFAKVRLPSKKEGEEGEEIVVYKVPESSQSQEIHPRTKNFYYKAVAEIMPSMLLQVLSPGFQADEVAGFGNQMWKNFFGTEQVKEKRIRDPTTGEIVTTTVRTRIPGLIERRFFG